MMYLSIRSTVCTREFLYIQKEISTKSKIYVCTETIDKIPSLAKACTTFEQKIFSYACAKNGTKYRCNPPVLFGRYFIYLLDIAGKYYHAYYV